mgnify:CR=1 FL=1
MEYYLQYLNIDFDYHFNQRISDGNNDNTPVVDMGMLEVEGLGVVSSISSTNTSASFTCFPNPSHGEIISFSKELNNIVFINALGNIVFQTETAQELNTSTLSSGVYILKSNEGTTKIFVE